MLFLVDTEQNNEEENEDDEEEDQRGRHFNYNQEEVFIIHNTKDNEGNYRQVVGGLHSERFTDRHLVRFKTVGEYYFQLENHPKKPPICKIRVEEEQPLCFLINEDGFVPRIIRIGKSIILVNKPVFIV